MVSSTHRWTPEFDSRADFCGGIFDCATGDKSTDLRLPVTTSSKTRRSANSRSWGFCSATARLWSIMVRGLSSVSTPIAATARACGVCFASAGACAPPSAGACTTPVFIADAFAPLAVDPTVAIFAFPLSRLKVERKMC